MEQLFKTFSRFEFLNSTIFTPSQCHSFCPQPQIPTKNVWGWGWGTKTGTSESKNLSIYITILTGDWDFTWSSLFILVNSIFRWIFARMENIRISVVYSIICSWALVWLLLRNFQYKNICWFIFLKYSYWLFMQSWTWL